MTHRVNFPGKAPAQLPDLAHLSPPARLSNSVADFRRHKNFFVACLNETKGTLPLLVTDQHLFSLPFYRALAEAYSENEITVISLDEHLDGIDPSYTNWGFWAFGIYLNYVKPANLHIIGSGQQLKAETFANERKCAAAGPLFYYQVIDEVSEFKRQAAAKVMISNPAINAGELRNDRRLRDFAEYSLLKNSGVSLRQSLEGLDLAGKPLFVSFDTDVTLRGESLLAIARLMREAELVGLHICELAQGVPIHGREEIEEFVKILVE